MNLRRTTALLCFFVLLGAGGGTILAQQTRRDAETPPLVVPLGAEGFVSFKLEARREAEEAAGVAAREAVAGVTTRALTDENAIVHRVLIDGKGRVVFGYDLRIEPHMSPAGAGRKFKITVKPIDDNFAARLPDREPGGEVATLPNASAAQVIDDGTGIAIELLVNKGTKTRIVDVVRVARDRARLYNETGTLLAAADDETKDDVTGGATVPPQALLQSEPRDFTLADARLVLRAPRLMVGGSEVFAARAKSAKELRGSLVWFHLPGRGRFIFSLAPIEGYDFRKIGVAENNRINFEWRGERYEWMSADPIVTPDARLYVWVMHDPGYDSRRMDVAPGDALTRGIESLEKQMRDARKPRAAGVTGFPRRAAKQDEDTSDAPHVTTGAADRIESLLYPRR